MEGVSVNEIILAAIGWLMIMGSVLAAIALVLLNRRHPFSGREATARLAVRSWSGRQTSLVVTCFISISLIMPFYRMLPGADENRAAEFLTVLAFSISQLTILRFIGRYRGKPWSEDFGMGRQHLRLLAVAPVIYLAAVPIIGICTFVYQRILTTQFDVEVEMQSIARLISESTSWVKAGYVMLAVVVAPLYEELIFRGVIFPFLVRRIGLPWGLMTVSAVFATLHFHLPTLLPLFLLSALLCLAYWRTGSLWVSIGIHAVFNGMTILVLSLQN